MADRLDEIKERERLATPGIWRVWDSCSWRRIGIDEPQRKVIEPMNDSDGHPNLLARREDLEFAAHARQDIPWLLGELAQAKADLAKAEALAKEQERRIADLEVTFQHTHQARYATQGPKAGKLLDSCDKCGFDLRDPLHKALTPEPAKEAT